MLVKLGVSNALSIIIGHLFRKINKKLHRQIKRDIFVINYSSKIHSFAYSKTLLYYNNL